MMMEAGKTGLGEVEMKEVGSPRHRDQHPDAMLEE
jgi:hypothetical protein